MAFHDLVFGIIFFIQTGVGVLGNFFLLCLYAITFLTGHRLKPIDSILVHLALSNSIVLIIKGIPQTMLALGLKNFLDNFACKFIIYIHRVARSLSLTFTCLLSVFQVITISSFTWFKLSGLKNKLPKNIVTFCLFSWILCLLMNIYMFANIQNFRENSNNTRIWHMGFCLGFTSGSFKALLLVITFSIPDFLCVGCMVMASGYLVLFLHRHHQVVQHIYSSSFIPRTSPETRATHTILVLVSTYVSFNSINSIMAIYLFQFEKYHLWLMPTSAFLAACFPAISPFVLIPHDSRILHLYYSTLGKDKLPKSSS
ncbi:vomeronasal 1 receptor monDomV1R1224 [Monodelphis domestica]|uniref:Vomeronasal type-1 receptor n=1 Tax=Monodelphis domestica TaxID=13616 RepID=F7E1L0_MONDO|nr:vomeronasal 1 receptor monDomV1R1224 [Monodelphis domestica]